MAVPKITKEDIEKFSDKLDPNHIEPRRKGKNYFVEINGVDYPIKYFIDEIAKYANKEEPEKNYASIDVYRCLKNLGCKVKEKDRNKESYYAEQLLNSKNIILRGAPGTGKTHLAKKIAQEIIGDEGDPNEQIGFVQFHPSYDYTDFVEGLRPQKNEDGTMGFALKNGVFKAFVDRARGASLFEIIRKNTTFGEDGETFKLKQGNQFYITEMDEEKIYVFAPDNDKRSKLKLEIKDLEKLLDSDQNFEQVIDITNFFGKKNEIQEYSYYLTLYKRFKPLYKANKKDKDKKYVFIIDEINRGEISKIFGELFFSIDPGYRGEEGAIFTQYANLHDDPNEKFFIPENVYIIGTMNDIDRSVDSFDFAMRRRFRFIELTAEESQVIIDDSSLDEKTKEKAKKIMDNLNRAIESGNNLNKNYQIGAAYFLKLKELNVEQLWEDCLEPLLRDYVQGMPDEESSMERFKRAYDGALNEKKVDSITGDTDNDVD